MQTKSKTQIKRKTEVQSKTEVNRKNAKGQLSFRIAFSRYFDRSLQAAMFCSSCGAKSCFANAKYCSKCPPIATDFLLFACNVLLLAIFSIRKKHRTKSICCMVVSYLIILSWLLILGIVETAWSTSWLWFNTAALFTMKLDEDK